MKRLIALSVFIASAAGVLSSCASNKPSTLPPAHIYSKSGKEVIVPDHEPEPTPSPLPKPVVWPQ